MSTRSPLFQPAAFAGWVRVPVTVGAAVSTM
jgi:hypothetical protein